MGNSSHPTRFALISPYTGSNLGDAMILEGLIRHLQRRVPEAAIVGVTLDPRRFSGIHRWPSVNLTLTPRAFYYSPPVTPKNTERQTGRTPTPSEPAPSTSFGARVVKRLKRSSLLRATWNSLRSARGILRVACCEVKHLRQAIGTVRNSSALIVSGGGQFDEEFGGPWGHPYSLAKWGTLAHIFGRKFFIAGVGVCELDSTRSISLVRTALRRAASITVRDEGSLALARKISPTAPTRLMADLSFLMATGWQRSWPSQPARPLTIGVSPIAFAREGSWPTANPALFERYLAEFVEFVRACLEQRHRIRLFCTDEPDIRIANEVFRQIDDTAAGLSEEFKVIPMLPVDEHLEFMRELDIVVASRLHGVILAHLASTPTIAVSYSRKVRAHMESIDQLTYCCSIEDFTHSRLIALITDMSPRLNDIAEHLRRACNARRSTATADVDNLLKLSLNTVIPANAEPA